MENTRKREKTRALLKEALIVLCDNENYYDITIQDICSKAGTYRSTFYRYYDTKDDLLREIENEYIATTKSLTATLRNFSGDASPDQTKIFLDELTADMEYHLANERVCRFLLSPAGDLAFRQKMIDSISDTVLQNFRMHGHMHDTNTGYLINFFASGFVSTIYSWLERKDRTANQIAVFLLDMMRQLKA